MPRHLLTGALLAAVLLFVTPFSTGAQEFNGKFSGFNEVGALNAETGAILSQGTGMLKLTLDESLQTITFELTYAGLSAPVTQSHIHFGKVHTPGGIMVFLRTNIAITDHAKSPKIPGGLDEARLSEQVAESTPSIGRLETKVAAFRRSLFKPHQCSFSTEARLMSVSSTLVVVSTVVAAVPPTKIATVMLLFELSTDFAGREGRGVNIAVGRA